MAASRRRTDHGAARRTLPARRARRLVDYEGIVEDITERHRHDEIVRRSERMASLGTTLAGVAHELNNPLAAIMGFAQLLLSKPWLAEDRAALETINHEAMRSATIVKDLLALARRRDVERRRRDRPERHRRATSPAHDDIRSETAGIACAVELQPGLPPVLRRSRAARAGHSQFAQQRRTGAARSRRRISPGPRSGLAVTIRTRRERHDVVLEIEDNGPGIPEDERSRIWDPFWTTKEEGEGTGLGLAVVHGIVVDHGGTISVESRPATARGSSFAFRSRPTTVIRSIAAAGARGRSTCS